MFLSGLAFLAQMAGGGFAPPVRHDIGAGTGGMAVGDLSGDGKPDVLLADYIHGIEVLPQS